MGSNKLTLHFVPVKVTIIAQSHWYASEYNEWAYFDTARTMTTAARVAMAPLAKYVTI